MDNWIRHPGAGLLAEAREQVRMVGRPAGISPGSAPTAGSSPRAAPAPAAPSSRRPSDQTRMYRRNGPRPPARHRSAAGRDCVGGTRHCWGMMSSTASGIGTVSPDIANGPGMGRIHAERGVPVAGRRLIMCRAVPPVHLQNCAEGGFSLARQRHQPFIGRDARRAGAERRERPPALRGRRPRPRPGASRPGAGHLVHPTAQVTALSLIAGEPVRTPVTRGGVSPAAEAAQ